MSMEKPKIEFSDKEDRVSITYKTDKGKVIVEFNQTSNNYHDEAGTYINDKDLHAKIFTTGPLGMVKKEKIALNKKVFHSENTGISGHTYEETGSINFFENIKSTEFHHDNKNIEALIKNAKKDIAKEIPNEIQRRNLSTMLRAAMEKQIDTP